MLASSREVDRSLALCENWRVKKIILPAVLALFSACKGSAPAPVVSPGIPAPTENWLQEKAEGEQKPLRKAWFAERHRSAPGADWKALEAANGKLQQERRNRLAGQLRSASPSGWTERGSYNQSGRMHVAMFSPDGSTLYGGSSLGGVWRGAADGSSWTPIGDNLYGGCHQLAVVSPADPTNPFIVLAATNRGDVHRSNDDGATWVVPAGLTALTAVRRIVVASDGSEDVYVVADRKGTTRIFRSSDRMASFTQVRSTGNFDGDLWMPRTGDGTLYALAVSGVWTSIDQGANWVQQGSFPISGQSGHLVGSEAGAPRLWAVVNDGSNQLYRSDDAGASWTFLQTLSGYWGPLNASIVDPDLFAWGGVELHKTLDAGATFNVQNTWPEYYGDPANKLHADMQGVDVWPLGAAGESWYVNTDGGVYSSTDLLASVDNLSLQGLGVSQYYTTHTSSANPDHVLAGAQDQGYQRASVAPPGSRTILDFNQDISGDYGHLVSGDGSHRNVFSVYPGFVLAHIGENNPTLKILNFPNGENYAWLPPLAGSVSDPKNFYFCATQLYLYRRAALFDAWTPELWSTMDFAASSGEYLSALSFSTIDPNLAFAATNRGRLFYSSDEGKTWTRSASNGPTPQYLYGTAVVASNLDPDLVYVGGSGYGVPAVYRSTDGGQSFQSWNNGLPDTLVYCMGEAPDGSGVMFCGTETSAYRRGPNDPSWVDITAGNAPITTYWSLEAHPTENVMRFGTYGRGIWDFQVDPPASFTLQNGSGINRNCFAGISAPVLGGTWSVSVDASTHAGATLTGFVVHPAPSMGSLLSGGELLVDLSTPQLLIQLGATSGGVDTYDNTVPNDPTLSGFTAFAQAFVLGNGYELCNSMQIQLGL